MQKNVEQSVCAAQQGEAKAFAALVHHFQDRAVGYVFGLLGDFHLAQDAAQDAFLEVHRTLADLREPAAFPAWFRKIVFKHCDRRLRRKRLATGVLNMIDAATRGDIPWDTAEYLLAHGA